MNFYYNILLFVLVLFLYIHIVHQYKRSEDLEIYEADYTSNTQLQEICEIKQPVLFNYKSINPEFYETVTYDELSSDIYANYDIRVKESADYWESEDSVDFVILPYSSGINLMKSDPKGTYFTENNEEFIEESGLISLMQKNNEYFKPKFIVYTKYDIMTGSRNSCTPLRYHTNYRHYLSVNSGKIRVKMTPWKSTKYLYQNRDFETYEFLSPINVWNPQKKYRHEMEKIRFLEFEVVSGFILSIPPYWWYSIQYDKGEDTILCGFTYNSIMNTVSNIPYLAKYYIQQNNIKKKITKIIQLDESNLETDAVEKSNKVERVTDIIISDGAAS